MIDYLVIGNSAGGVGAIEAIRGVDREGSISIVGDEPFPAYSRPAISELLCGAKSFERIVYRPEFFYDQHQVIRYLGRSVERILASERTVTLDGGETLPFRRLLVATGGTPIVPPTPGDDKSGIYTFTTARDAWALRARIESVGKRVVVIGGGLIGTSVSDALIRAGAEVTMVELRDRVLSLLLDEPASELARQAMVERGVDLRCGQTVREITGRGEDDSSVGGVVLQNGERIACDAVVVAIGVRPRSEVAAVAGITVNRGVVVDQRMETNISGIYACGDVAEAYDFVFGGKRVVPIWPGAYMGGRVAGLNMAGRVAESRDATVMNSLKYFGLPIVSAGEINVDGVAGYEVLRNHDPIAASRGQYKKIVLRDGRLAGFLFAQDIERAGIVFALLRQGVDVSAFKESLLADDLDLISLPYEWRRGQYDRATQARQTSEPAAQLA